MKLGDYIRSRRRRLRISQQKLAENSWSRSFISQVELNKIQPSLETLSIIAQRLDTTVGDIIGDSLLLRKAKASILHPHVCQEFLNELPKTSTTIFLQELTQALQYNEQVSCKIPPNAELYYLTARVLIYQEKYQQGISTLQSGLRYADEFWRLLLLGRLCDLYKLLNQKEDYARAKHALGTEFSDIADTNALRKRIIADLREEKDSVRCQELLNFLTALDFPNELTEWSINNQ